jgi:hypothetical protein
MAERIKINVIILQDYISQYKASFAEHRFGTDNEIYKWKAVKCFQDNWNIDAPDFSAMLKSALAKTYNLLASNQFFPKKMLEVFADSDPEEMRRLFRELFDEKIDVAARVKAFEERTAKLLETYPNLKMTYQNPNSISTYLWLCYPDKYYIYKYSVIKDNTHKLCGIDLPTGKLDRMLFGFYLYDMICEELAKDTELVSMSRNSLTDDCYLDAALKTLTIDMGYFISKHEAKLPHSGSAITTDSFDKNIILYGPPGTGKTYSVVQYAVAIIEEKTLETIKAEDYEVVFKRYLKYKDDGQIAFSTFHQSFGYEEFIEGIRPVLTSDESGEEEKNLKYKLHDGIFKALCLKAELNIASPFTSFENAWDALVNAAPAKGEKYVFTHDTGSTIEAEFINEDCFRVNWNSNIKSHNDLTKQSIYEQWLHNKDRSELTGGNRWMFDARKAVINELAGKYNLPTLVKHDNHTKNYVFIIDEINRGNISKIFGELITLIEPTKRIGASEELRALLPYSGQNFGVPANIYIIGTMNTADRSIAIIDTALRRRFSFVEMQPDSSLLRDIVVDGVDIAEMLDTMNRRIMVLLDREHTIGHSYLFPLKDNPSVEFLAKIFENNIIPLLQEYFYDDYEKIQFVLGDNRKSDDSIRFIVKKSDTAKLFGNADIDYPEFYEINREAFKKIEAYASLN